MVNQNDNEKKCTTQKKQIKAYLLTGKRLTQLDALYRFGCMRLAARVCELRDDGMNIKTERIKVPSGKIVASYFIP
jgi:hypothetical protein